MKKIITMLSAATFFATIPILLVIAYNKHIEQTDNTENLANEEKKNLIPNMSCEKENKKVEEEKNEITKKEQIEELFKEKNEKSIQITVEKGENKEKLKFYF